MASQAVLLVTLVSLASWIASGTRTVKDVLEMEEKLSNDPSDWDPRIIGGRPAEEKEFPWMVALHYKGRFICSAFLAAKGYVFTAAHCVKLRDDRVEPAEHFKGYMGTIKRDGDGAQTEAMFSDVLCHEEYGSGTEYDIALLKLKTPVETSDSIQPVCLPAKGSNFDDTMAQAMGWGVYQKNGREPSPVLLTVPEHVPTNAKCQHVYGMLGIPVTERHVCAGGSDTGVCFGDSGGPLVNLNGTHPRAIGITSFGSYLGCAVKRVPAVFTSTESYHDWIEETMGDDAKDLCYA